MHLSAAPYCATARRRIRASRRRPQQSTPTGKKSRKKFASPTSVTSLSANCLKEEESGEGKGSQPNPLPPQTRSSNHLAVTSRDPSSQSILFNFLPRETPSQDTTRSRSCRLSRGWSRVLSDHSRPPDRRKKRFRCFVDSFQKRQEYLAAFLLLSSSTTPT